MITDQDGERLALALAAARLGDWSWDVATDVVICSARAAEIFQIPPGPHMTWAAMRELLHPDDRERARVAVEEAIHSRGYYSLEYRLINGGRERWVSSSGHGRYAADGRVLGMLGVVQDVSKDRMLVRLDDAVRSLIDPEAITYTAARFLGQHLDVNRCAYATVEADEDTFELTGNYTHGVHSIVGRYTFRQFGLECLRLMRAGEPYVVTDSASDPRLDDADREAYRLTAIASVICVPILKNRRFVAAMAVHARVPRDWRGEEVELVQQVASRCWESIERARVDGERRVLLERERLAREEAELQKRLLHSLFMQAPTLIAVLRGPDHVIELANPPMCEVWGRSNEAVVNRPVFDVMPELVEAKGILDDVYRSGQTYAAHETAITIDRGAGVLDTVYGNFVYSPFRNVQGHIDGVFIIASDVTDQVRARQEVDRLRQAAEAANRAKDEFMAILGHELRNPLSPILTALHLMKLRGSDESVRERTVIERQISHLTRLVDDLLDVSRIARGKVALKTEVIQMSEIVARAIETSSPLLEQRTQTLTLDVPRSGLAVDVDVTRLSQVVSNLLTNAAKYTPPGGRITLIAQREENTVVLTVRDTGIGISAEVLPHVFDLFVQERQAMDRAQGGLGLGLTIVQSLVERHGGTVAAHSEGIGKGSEFVVRLPAVPDTSADSLDFSRNLPRAARDAGRRVRILVVDDNQDAAELLAEALQVEGHRTEVARDGPHALRLAEVFLPEVVFLDLGLPIMDGYELAARLRNLPGLNHVVLVAVTGYGQESDRRRTAAAGFEHHLVKPVDIAALMQMLPTLTPTR